MKIKSIILAVGLSLQLAFAGTAQITITPTNVVKTASDITMAWDASPDAAVTGYNLYYGTNSGIYSTNKINVGNVLTATVRVTPRGVLYFYVATAFDTNGIESPFSNEISNAIPNLIPQNTLTLTTNGSLVYGTTNSLSVVGGSGLGAVTYSIISGPGTLIGNTSLVVTSASGPITIVATKAEDDIFSSISVTSVVSVVKSSQIITFASIATQKNNASVILSASSTSKLPITYAVVSGKATIANGVLNFQGVGTVVISASQSGDANYLAATNVNNTIAVVSYLPPPGLFRLLPLK